ncbi:MAG TPA: hypothetical protein VGF75_07035 [Candidatus Saccharimonadales bacterium]|jgi:hypothetical protein
MDVDARLQLFDLKTVYQFQTSPGVDQYNMPLYDVQVEGTSPGTSNINFYPVYQGFLPTARVNGINVPFYTQRSQFFDMWPNYVQPVNAVASGNGGANYTIQLPFAPGSSTVVNVIPSGLLRGHVDITGIIATGNNVDPPVSTTINLDIPTTSIFPAIYFTTVDSTGASVVVQDSGQFLNGNVNYGLLMRPGAAPNGGVALNGGYSTALNTINYNTGAANVTFTDSSGNPLNIPAGQQINAQCYFYNPGLPRAILFYNNILTLRNPPDIQYLVELDAYLSPAAFLNSGSAIPFAYMSEYIARGAARKILSDTGDTEQFNFYESLFREQEMLVWKRSQRQWTATRTPTIYSQGSQSQGQYGTSSSIGTT